MPDESLLTAEIRALIGRTTPMGTVEITLRAVRRSLEVYLGAAEAERRTRDLVPGDPVAGYVIEALGSDFNVESDGNGLPSVLPNSLLISNEWQFERALRLGEHLTVASRLADISERFGGKFGYSLDFRTEVQFAAPDGEVVARNARSMMQYNAAGNEGAGA
ncbi:MAG TPA: hypothetical protein VN697_16105 [Tepidiformaceae bacterium]|nr:hypothetical protein [Tepidiformaceae bacterium]